MKPCPVRIRQFLLGSLSDADSAELMRQARADSYLRLDIEVAESNLIDDYAMAVLSEEDRQAFEQNFLISEDRRERLAIAKGVLKMTATERTRRRVFTSIGSMAAAVLFAVAGYQFSVPPGPILSLKTNATRGSASPGFSLNKAPATLLIDLDVPDFPLTATATVTRIGEDSPRVAIQLPHQTGTTVRLAIEKHTLPEGEYVISLRAGTEFQLDYLFHILP